jgi:hypothetical protein
MPNVSGKKFPYTPAGKAAAKDEAKKIALKRMVENKKANTMKGATPTPMIASGGPTKPKSPSGMLMKPAMASPAPAKARAYGEAPKKAMPSKKMIDKKFGK